MALLKLTNAGPSCLLTINDRIWIFVEREKERERERIMYYDENETALCHLKHLIFVIFNKNVICWGTKF